MKNLRLLFLFLALTPLSAWAQYTAGVRFGTGAPTNTPSTTAKETQLHYDISNKRLFEHQGAGKWLVKTVEFTNGVPANSINAAIKFAVDTLATPPQLYVRKNGVFTLLSSVTTVGNGISKSGDSVLLGGTLTKPTTITATTNRLTIAAPTTNNLQNQDGSILFQGTSGISLVNHFNFLQRPDTIRDGVKQLRISSQYYTDSIMAALFGKVWSLTGNAGTTAGTHFIGTTDAQDLVFKTNGTERLRILGNGEFKFNKYFNTLLYQVNNYSSLGLTNEPMQFFVGEYSTNQNFQIGNLVIATNSSNGNTSAFIGGGNTGSAKNAFSFRIDGVDVAKGLMYDQADNLLSLYSSSTINTRQKRLNIDDNGMVGINTTTPQYRFDIDAITNSAGNPLRLQGLKQGANTDSLLTSLNGVIRRIAVSELGISGGGGSTDTISLSNRIIAETDRATLSEASKWSILGNAGTNPTTNFLGTTDAQDLVLKTNNTERFRILASPNIKAQLSTVGLEIHRLTSNYAMSIYNDTYSSTTAQGIFWATNTGEFRIQNLNVGESIQLATGTGSSAIKMELFDNKSVFTYNPVWIYKTANTATTIDSTSYYMKIANTENAISNSNVYNLIGLGRSAANFQHPTAIGFKATDTYRGNIVFATRNNNTDGIAPTVKMSIIPSGFVGIGDTVPTNRLTIDASSEGNPLKLVGVQTGTTGDSLLTIQTGGVVKKIPVSAIASVSKTYFNENVGAATVDISTGCDETGQGYANLLSSDFTNVATEGAKLEVYINGLRHTYKATPTGTSGLVWNISGTILSAWNGTTAVTINNIIIKKS